MRLTSFVTGLTALLANLAIAHAAPSTGDAAPGSDRDPAVTAPTAATTPARDPAGPTVAPDDDNLTPLARYASHDAAANRAYAMPTAVVAPPGSIIASARQPIAGGGVEEVTVATSFMKNKIRAEASVGFGWDPDARGLTWSVKIQPVLRGRATFALIGGDWFTHVSTDATAKYYGVVGSTCLGECRTLLSVQLGEVESYDRRSPFGVGVGSSLVTGSDRWKLVVEADTVLGCNASAALYVGGRYLRGRLSIDAGLASAGRARVSHCYAIEPQATWVPVWPMLAASYRLR